MTLPYVDGIYFNINVLLACRPALKPLDRTSQRKGSKLGRFNRIGMTMLCGVELRT